MVADIYDGMRDRWPVNHQPIDQPKLAFAVTPSDTLDLPGSSSTPSYAKELWIGGSTNSALAVIMAGDKTNSGSGTSVTFSNVPAGRFPYQVRRVMATGTTVTNIVALMD